MRKLFLVFLTLIALVVIGYYIYQEHRFQKFHVNDNKFLVEKEAEAVQKNETLQTLVELRKRLDRVVSYVSKKYPNNSKVKRMKQRFSDTVLKEATPKNKAEGKNVQTSYTVNKGATMVLCLRTPDNNLVDINTLTYVAVHELAHIYSSSLHHSPEFWENMKFLVNEATEAGIYRTVNYQKNPVAYCGLHISSNLPA